MAPSLNTHAHTHTHTHTHIHKYTNTQVQTHTHTHTHNARAHAPQVAGVYSIAVKSTAAAAQQSQGAPGGAGASPYRDGVIDVLVMENIFYDRPISRWAGGRSHRGGNGDLSVFVWFPQAGRGPGALLGARRGAGRGFAGLARVWSHAAGG